MRRDKEGRAEYALDDRSALLQGVFEFSRFTISCALLSTYIILSYRIPSKLETPSRLSEDALLPPSPASAADRPASQGTRSTLQPTPLATTRFKLPLPRDMTSRAPVSSSSNNNSTTDTPLLTLKRRRITRACDRCHKGGIKCAASNDPDVCLPCASFGSECTYDRPIKRRGPAARRLKGEDGQDGLVGTLHEQSGSPDEVPVLRRKARRVEEEDRWRAEHVASSDVIEHLVEGYLRIVYPM